MFQFRLLIHATIVICEWDPAANYIPAETWPFANLANVLLSTTFYGTIGTASQTSITTLGTLTGLTFANVSSRFKYKRGYFHW
jgi:hypothetical protein